MKNLFVFDAHCDTALALWERGASLHENAGQWDLKRTAHLPGWAQVFAFCPICSPFAVRCGAQAVLQQAYENFMQQLQKNNRTVCRETAQLQANLPTGAVLLSLEGGEGANCDPGRLALLYKQGFSMTGLTWNYENDLAGSHLTGRGLTARGAAYVRAAQRLGMLVDLSHISDHAFWEVCRLTQLPLVASHSNSRSICSHSRNLTDGMYQAICQSGGVVGLNFYAPFLSETAADFSCIWHHLDHFLQCAGDDTHVALGADLDGCDCLAAGFGDVESYLDLADYLLAQGLSERTLRRVYYENLMEVYRKCTH